MTSDSPPPRVAVYARVSTTRQAESDLSLPDQIRQIEAFCERKGWKIVEVFTEPGASALDDDRPAFQDMIYKATRPEQPYDYVAVHSLSRFSRDLLHSELYVRQLRKAGVQLVSITQELADDTNGELIRKIFSAFDEHQSRENAKHVHRAMKENARQGFWNGARPPFGYATKITDRRGNRDKKVLVIDANEAPVVRNIFELYLGKDGPPRGMKAIINKLNGEGLLRRGRKWSIGSLHDLMTSPTYCGRHLFNRRNSRTQERRPPSEWVEVKVPAIVSEEVFNEVGASLHARSPRRMAPRFVTGPTMLASVARCGECGAALVLNTGKGGRYRYYSCSRSQREGKTACPGRRIRMDRLDSVVLDLLSRKLFKPDRLAALLKVYLADSAAEVLARKERLKRARDARGETDAGTARLLALVETGAMEPNDPALRERLAQLRLRRDELDREISALQDELLTGIPALTADKIATLSQAMRQRLEQGPSELKQAYMRLFLDKVEVREDEIRLAGSKAVLAKAALKVMPSSVSEVLSYARQWRARQESNLRPAA